MVGARVQRGGYFKAPSQVQKHTERTGSQCVHTALLSELLRHLKIRASKHWQHILKRHSLQFDWELILLPTGKVIAFIPRSGQRQKDVQSNHSGRSFFFFLNPFFPWENGRSALQYSLCFRRGQPLRAHLYFFVNIYQKNLLRAGSEKEVGKRKPSRIWGLGHTSRNIHENINVLSKQIRKLTLAAFGRNSAF